MSILTAGELTNLRTKQNSANLYLSILKPAILLSAQVNDASVTRGQRIVNYDSGTGNATGYGVISTAVAKIAANDGIGTSLMAEITTNTGVELVRVKSISGNEVSGTLTFAEHGINLGDDDSVVIKHFFQVVPVAPAIRSGIFYKDFDIAFLDQNTTPNPVAIIGTHFAGFLAAGSIVFQLNSSSSYATAQGATISSRAWACVHNGGGTAGITLSSAVAANPTLTITQADTYWLSCQVTDSNGKTQTTYRAVFVYDADNPPEIDFTVQQLTADWDSAQWRCSLNITDNVTLADLPDGSLAVLWYQSYFNDTEAYVNVWSFGDNIVFTGYLWSDNDNDNWQSGTAQVAFEIISPLAYLDAITDYGTVSLEAATSPAKWSDYASWLSVGRGIHHLLKWDTTILEVCDVLGLTDNTYGVKVLEFTEDTLLQRIQGVAYQRGIHAKLVSNRIGQLVLVQDSQMLNTAGRAALDTVFTLATSDISGGVNLVRNNETIRAFADLDGFTYSHPTSTPFISMIPGYIESTVSYNLPQPRGIGSETIKQQVLNSAGGQTDCNERVGRALALANVSPREIRVDMRSCYLGAFDIAPSIGWYNWGIANNALQRGLSLNGLKFVCRSVSHQFNYAEGFFTGFIQTTEVVLQPEASGPDGIPGNYPTSYPAITTQQPTWDESGADVGGIDDFIVGYIAAVGGAAAKVGQIGTISFGAAATFDIDATAYVAICALSATKALMCYTTATNGRAAVLDISGTTITPGSTYDFDTEAAYIAVCAMSATQAIVVYREIASTLIKAKTLNVSGTVVSLGAEITVSSGAGSACGITRLTATRAICSYVDAGITGTLAATILDVSGTNVTATYSASLDSDANLATSIATLDSTTAIVVFDGPVFQNFLAYPLYNIGATFTKGLVAILDAVNNSFDSGPATPIVTAIDSTRAVACYQTASGSPFAIRAIAMSYSGGAITPGTSIEVSPHTVNYDEFPACAFLGGNRCAVIYSTFISGIAEEGQALTVTIDATIGLTDNGEDEVYDAAGSLYKSVARLEAI